MTHVQLLAAITTLTLASSINASEPDMSYFFSGDDSEFERNLKHEGKYKGPLQRLEFEASISSTRPEESKYKSIQHHLYEKKNDYMIMTDTLSNGMQLHYLAAYMGIYLRGKAGEEYTSDYKIKGLSSDLPGIGFKFLSQSKRMKTFGECKYREEFSATTYIPDLPGKIHIYECASSSAESASSDSTHGAKHDQAFNSKYEALYSDYLKFFLPALMISEFNSKLFNEATIGDRKYSITYKDPNGKTREINND